MQSVLPHNYTLAQPTTYSTFEADEIYRRAHQEPTVVAHPAVRSNVVGNPQGSTVIQTETPTKHIGGFRGKMENWKLRAGEHMGIGTDTATRWSLYQINEPLFSEFRAKIVNGNFGYSKGFILISQNYLCFSSFTDKHNRAIKVTVPLKNIVKISLAQRLRNTSGPSVVLTPLSSLSMKANALQIFTRDGVLHQFFGFRKQTEQMFNTLNLCWQASTGINANTVSHSAYDQALMDAGYKGQREVIPQQFANSEVMSNLPAGSHYQTTSGSYTTYVSPTGAPSARPTSISYQTVPLSQPLSSTSMGMFQNPQSIVYETSASSGLPSSTSARYVNSTTPLGYSNTGAPSMTTTMSTSAQPSSFVKEEFIQTTATSSAAPSVYNTM